MDSSVQRLAEAFAAAERILIISGAGLSADSGLPTYRGHGGIYNGHTEDGIAIEQALSAEMFGRDPGLSWKYLAQLAQACLSAGPNLAHQAIAQLQQLKPNAWVLTQNIDGYHRLAGSPAERLIEIHGQLQPLYCPSCAAQDADLIGRLRSALPPLCKVCSAVLRPPVTLFGEMLPQAALRSLQDELAKGFELVLSVGTSASFPYILEPVLRTRQSGGLTAEVNLSRTPLTDLVNIHLRVRALDVFPVLLSHISGH